MSTSNHVKSQSVILAVGACRCRGRIPAMPFLLRVRTYNGDCQYEQRHIRWRYESSEHECKPGWIGVQTMRSGYTIIWPSNGFSNRRILGKLQSQPATTLIPTCGSCFYSVLNDSLSYPAAGTRLIKLDSFSQWSSVCCSGGLFKSIKESYLQV